MGNIYERAARMSNNAKPFMLLQQVEIDDNTDNGLYFNNVYVPQEIVCLILSYVESDKLLVCSRVCKKWNNIVKSFIFWATKYYRKYGRKPKKLPWYLFYCLFATDLFDVNLLKNGCGEEGYKHWNVQKNYGDEFQIEDPPLGAEPLPLNILDFNGKTSCFSTSYYECSKEQIIPFNQRRLFAFILDVYKPHIYASEWVAGRFDCGCIYTLKCSLMSKKNEPLKEHIIKHVVDQWEGKKWSKMEILFKEYPEGVQSISFQHEGQDKQFWKGHYGSKMAGGVVRVLFDTIEPLEEAQLLN